MMDIQKNIAIPTVSRASTSKIRDDLSKLEAGDSFFLAAKTTNQAHSTFSPVAKTLGFKLTVRSVEEDGVCGVRVWRV